MSFSVTANRMKSHMEQRLVLHGAKLSEVKNLVFVDFYEIHQDHVDRTIVNPKIIISIQTLKIISPAY